MLSKLKQNLKRLKEVIKPLKHGYSYYGKNTNFNNQIMPRIEVHIAGTDSTIIPLSVSFNEGIKIVKTLQKQLEIGLGKPDQEVAMPHMYMATWGTNAAISLIE